MIYTVKNAMPTGNSSPQFGTEFYVQFNEIEDTATLWFKKQPEAGGQLELEQVNGKWKKVKKPWSPTTGTPAQITQAPASATTATRSYKDNSDGQRQGMCLNNAANYVNTLEFPQALTDREWASLVHSYATALYILGDLKEEPKYATSVAELMDGS